MKAKKLNRKVEQIISGGQSGVDRAALDFALQNNISCGGWCPEGRMAEDGIIPSKYPLKETNSDEVSVRTYKNIEWADGTLIIHSTQIDQGTQTTIDDSIQLKKPYFIIDLNETINTIAFSNWIDSNKIRILNIAGPRESNSKGIYVLAYKFLESIKHLF